MEKGFRLAFIVRGLHIQHKGRLIYLLTASFHELKCATTTIHARVCVIHAGSQMISTKTTLLLNKPGQGCIPATSASAEGRGLRANCHDRSHWSSTVLTFAPSVNLENCSSGWKISPEPPLTVSLERSLRVCYAIQRFVTFGPKVPVMLCAQPKQTGFL